MAEITRLAELLGRPAPAPAPRTGSFHGPDSLAERIRRDPPPPGVRRFYNTAFVMPERPRRGQ